MNGILFIDFNLVACDFLKFDWCKMLKLSRFFIQHLLLENDCCISQKCWKVEDGTWINLNNDVNIHLLMFFVLELGTPSQATRTLPFEQVPHNIPW